ncbi:Hydroxysteroid dehydrogenase-like protein 2 [Apiospora arundinis]|uniref:Hydroxysteroid dehydrogenase-like protein 2 n=1 Tax=Apiospora arundinis TaxID=335852 RepID=A0ABR2J8B8_9PEZI
MGTQKVVLIVGASRGIGRQIAIDLAKNGFAVVVAAKSSSDRTISNAAASAPFPPDPNSSDSTITTVAREVREAGGEATAIPVDVRDPASIRALVAKTVEVYGRLDALVYNAGAVWWASVEDTPLKRFRLMQQVNVEGLYATIEAALPHLKKGGTGRIVVVSPPIYSRFFRGKTAYAMGKVGMSVLTKGLAMDFERQGLKNMSITSIWPAVAIESAATQKLQKSDPSTARDLRKPTIFSDAVLAILRDTTPAASVNGLLALDEDFLRSDLGGRMADFSRYALVPGATPRRIMPKRLPDLTVEEQDDEGTRINSAASVPAKAKL